VSSNANCVAHTLAKGCEAQPSVWFEVPPNFNLSLL
jgi:hypothetical protein